MRPPRRPRLPPPPRPPRCALLLLPLLLVAGLACEPEPPRPPFVRDAEGGALILHGVNLSGSAKGAPDRLPWVDPDAVHRLSRDWGFDFVRYLIFWDAVEPEPGEIDFDYLAAVRERLDWMAEAGLHVVLDMHQDVYARRFCCDGAPAWAIRDDGIPYDPSPVWSLNYFAPAVMRAFDNFWDADGPNADLQEHYARVWKTLAGTFAGHPALLGYDFMNEPSPGSWISPSEYVLVPDPGGLHQKFDETRFAAFYARMIAAVRSEDPDSWIFYEPRFGSVAGGMPSYLPRLADPRPEEDRIAYFPHLYSVQVEVSGRYDRANDRALPLWEKERAADVARQGAPLLIGEFGTLDSTVNGPDLLRDVVDLADRMNSGWAYWEYNDDGFGFLQSRGGPEKTAKTDVLVRAYPQRVAGDPLEYAYDADARVLRLRFARNPDARGPTRIYVPVRRFYPEGFRVEVSDPEWHSEWDPDAEVLSLWTDPEQPLHEVVVRPATP